MCSSARTSRVQSTIILRASSLHPGKERGLSRYSKPSPLGLSMVGSDANSLQQSDSVRGQPGRTDSVSKDIIIAAPVRLCFEYIASQLEQPPGWDPIIVDCRPMCKARARIGAESQVTVNLGGKRLKSVASVLRYRPKNAISWAFTNRPLVREDWRLKRKANGTRVRVTLTFEVDGWPLGWFLYRLRRKRKLEQDMSKMMIQLKGAAEGRR